MSHAHFHLAIYAADKAYFTGEVSSLIVPTTEGKLGFMANHVNTVVAIVPGEVEYTIDESKYYAVVSTGIMKFEDNEAMLLLTTVENPDDIDLARAIEAREEALEKLRAKRNNRELMLAQANLIKENNRIKQISKTRNRQHNLT